MLEELKRKLTGQQLSDILTVGTTDMEEVPRRFEPHLRFLYLEFSELILELESVAQEGILKITILESIRFGFAAEDSEAQTYSSVQEFLLDDCMANNTSKTLTLFGAIERENHVLCDAARLVLQNNQVLFFDPSYIYGLQVGGASQELAWEANLRPGVVPLSEMIDLT